MLLLETWVIIKEKMVYIIVMSSDAIAETNTKKLRARSSGRDLVNPASEPVRFNAQRGPAKSALDPDLHRPIGRIRI